MRSYSTASLKSQIVRKQQNGNTLATGWSLDVIFSRIINQFAG
ncbi:MAG: hypothetical protein ABI675_23560 [Chitinophagaceae bacterium]